ncbi:hypothetical protein XI04_08540 [Bradyrhizobium sp. CCBAU 11430]|uniref:hypothetical protein n=1 Tax=Bradyrhizobium sp. CCBAU 11430 TaxID=1630881 RepID=UPI002306027A|nr:hypothetical protein [Bradyrhizobium sp. CCBAU 11430]MDA9513100.1 hypothetical protein [Bradyrhizobium sp. CCBAU 11430]
MSSADSLRSAAHCETSSSYIDASGLNGAVAATLMPLCSEIFRALTSSTGLGSMATNRSQMKAHRSENGDEEKTIGRSRVAE